ncbi:MAG: glycosyltransferase involved in cell wall biosynthesis [Alphaproteobacteria bacterium]
MFDVALQPQVVAYASPLKLFEYMALGRAIVAPNQRNIQEILEHEKDALLFDPLYMDEFSEMISRLMNDEELRASLGKNAVATIHNRGLTWDSNAKRVEDLFNELLENSK